MANKSEAYINGWLAHRRDSQEPEIRGNRPQIASKNPYCENRQFKSRIDWDTGYFDRQRAVFNGEDLLFDKEGW